LWGRLSNLRPIVNRPSDLALMPQQMWHGLQAVVPEIPAS
jgi:hypothetical protein